MMLQGVVFNENFYGNTVAQKIDSCKMAFADDFQRNICCRNGLYHFKQVSISYNVLATNCIVAMVHVSIFV